MTGAGARRPGDHSGKVTRVRIICDDLSHARTLVDIASFKRTPPAGGEGVGSWEEYWNDSPFASEEELDQGRPHEVPLAPKRVVRDAERTSDVFECPKCRRRLLINRNDMDARLERLHLAGMSHLSFPELASILGTGCSSSWVEVQRGGNPKRRLRPPHQGMGMSSSGMPASMSTGV